MLVTNELKYLSLWLGHTRILSVSTQRNMLVFIISTHVFLNYCLCSYLMYKHNNTPSILSVAADFLSLFKFFGIYLGV